MDQLAYPLPSARKMLHTLSYSHIEQYSHSRYLLKYFCRCSIMYEYFLRCSQQNIFPEVSAIEYVYTVT